MLKFKTELLRIWDYKDLIDILINGIDVSKEIPLLAPIPAAWAIQILNELVLKPKYVEDMNRLYEQAVLDFEGLKFKGVEACIEYLDNSTLYRKDRLKLKYLKTTTSAIQILLKGKFMSVEEIIQYTANTSRSTSEWTHTIYYNEMNDRIQGKINVINCIFIGDL